MPLLTTDETAVSRDNLLRLGESIFLSAAITHYLLQGIILWLGGHPNFSDLNSPAINVAVMSLFLFLAWILRRVALVSIVFVTLGLVFLAPWLFLLKGTWNTWAMQFATYTVLPLGSAFIFKKRFVRWRRFRIVLSLRRVSRLAQVRNRLDP